jgi:hypothetical protein
MGRRALTLAALAAIVAPAGSLADAAVEVPVPVPAGVADAEGTLACIRTAEDGVEAVDVASGRRLWASAAPARALLVSGGTAWLLEEREARALRVSAYDARSGRPAGAWALAALRLPAWARLAEARGREQVTFTVTARLAGGTLELGWDARRTLIGGTGAHPGGESHGVARLDVASGAVEVTEGARDGPPPVAVPAPGNVRIRLARFHARAADGTLALGGPPPDVEGLLVAGGARIGFERAAGRPAILVHRLAPDGSATAAPLEIPADADAIWPTLDRRHVALRRAHDQRWVDVHGLDRGERVVTLEHPADLAVVGRHVLWTRLGGDGLVLAATELASGRTAWRRTVLRFGERGDPIP